MPVTNPAPSLTPSPPVAIAAYFINYTVETWPGQSNASGAKFLAGAQGAFAVGRFMGTFFMKFFKARWVFLAYLSGVIAFLAASITQRKQSGMGMSFVYLLTPAANTQLTSIHPAMLFMTLFFESVCFPTIVALGIRGLGRHYKRGSGFIIAGVAGGAVVPPILGHVADMRNNTGFAMIIPTMVGCLFFVCWCARLADWWSSSLWSLLGRIRLRSTLCRAIGIPSTGLVRVLLGFGMMKRLLLVLLLRLNPHWRKRNGTVRKKSSNRPTS